MSIRKSIFVVDDDSSMREGMKRLLSKHGFNAILFEFGAELLSNADFGAAFCIVLDIDLKGNPASRCGVTSPTRGASCRLSSSPATIVRRTAQRQWVQAASHT